MRDHAEETRSGKRLAAAGIVVVAVSIVAGALTLPRLRAQGPAGAADRATFDVVSIKPNKSGDGRAAIGPQPGGRFRGTDITVGMLMNIAYQLKPHQIVGGPDWMSSEHFDIEAKAEGNPPMAQMRLMLQSLLVDRFKLVVHRETRPLPIYALVLLKAGKTGPRLALHSDDTTCADISAGPPPPSPGEGPALIPCGGFLMGNGRLAAQKVTIEMFGRTLGNFVDRIVVDKTGLNGIFDVDFEFTPLQSPFGAQIGPDASTPDPSAPPSIFTAVQEQLGLKLESQTGPVDVLVIDHVERPSEN